MAHIDELVKSVDDPRLRSDLERAVQKLRKARRFGLVFEEHIPEVIALPGLSVELGGLAQVSGRSDALYRVVSIDGDTVEVLPLGASRLDDPEAVDTSKLTPVLRFGEPIYPTLEHVGAVERGPRDAPHHMVIESENYHALQLLVHLYERQVDCIYIDPPYNSGATDWKYNNRYIESNDAYRHSKWLSMMDKRLRIARRLLKRDGVLIVAIDTNELHHLWLLLEQLFPDYFMQMVTVVANRSGASSPHFRRIDEQLIYCFGPEAVSTTTSEINYSTGITLDKSKTRRHWESFVRTGTGWTPSSRPNMVYPVGIDPDTLKIIGTGPTLKDRFEDKLLGPKYQDRKSLDGWTPNPSETVTGYPTVWPWHQRGDNPKRLGIWRLVPDSLMELSRKGYVRVSHKDNSYQLTYLLKGTIQEIETATLKTLPRVAKDDPVQLVEEPKRYRIKTVWNRSEHLTEVGSNMLSNILGESRFAFPKPLYAVRDALLPVVANRESALILDFFAGSGTTLHATLLLNEIDGGSRQCILVTNNEVGPKEERRLLQDGVEPESYQWRRVGIFESVTRPRIETVISGERYDGENLSGKYIGSPEREMASGFEASARFLRLRYLDPESVIAEDCFDSIHPMLWAAAGAVGSCPTVPVGHRLESHDPGYLVPDGSIIPLECRYAVLLRESRFGDFAAQLADYEQVTHVWLRAQSESSLVEMCALLPMQLKVSWLFREMFRQFDREGRGNIR